jgi:hypothetical protein
MTQGDPGTYEWLTEIWVGPDPNVPESTHFEMVWAVAESPTLDPPDYRQATCYWPGVWLRGWRCSSGLLGGPLDPSTAGVLTLDVSVANVEDADRFSEGRFVHVEVAAYDSPGAYRGVFTGTITSVVVTPSGIKGTGRTSVDVVVTDLLAYLGRATVGDVPWPLEFATTRIDRIIEAAVPRPASTDADPNPRPVVGAMWWGTNAGLVATLAEGSHVAARDVDAQPAQKLLELTVGYGAIVVAPSPILPTAGRPWGPIASGIAPLHIYPSPVRSLPDPEEPVELIPCTAIVAGTEWTRDAETLVNTVTVTTGNVILDEEGNEKRQEVTVRDPASIRRWGPRSRSLSTDWADVGDAATAGLILTGRLGRPRTRMSTLVVDPHRIPASDTVLHPGDTLLRTPLWSGVVDVELPVHPAETRPDGTPRWSATQRMYLDSIEHQVTRGSWRIVLGVSHPDDVGPLWTYDPADPTGVPADESWATWRPDVPFDQLDAPGGL